MATRNKDIDSGPAQIEVWRTGNKLGRTLYVNEVLVGMVDSPAIASRIVVAMNMAQLQGTHERTQPEPIRNDS